MTDSRLEPLTGWGPPFCDKPFTMHATDYRCQGQPGHEGPCRAEIPPLYSGPRCSKCGGDHFPQEPTPEHVKVAEVARISEAVFHSPVLQRLITQLSHHAREHRTRRGCEMCYLWLEYHYGLLGRDVPK